MRRSAFTYLRASALLRVFSALVFIALTGASVSANVCSNCATIKTKSVNQTESCPMAQSDNAPSQKRSTCCCAHAMTDNESANKTPLMNNETAQKNSMSCCAETKKTEGSASTAPEIQTASAHTTIVDINKPLGCQLSGSCPKQMRTDTHKSSSPPPRNFEQERQNNLNISFHTEHISQFIERATAPNDHIFSALSGGPPNLSGIGSQLLLC